jgi:negative regulator of flagellin synthesis FlgM
MIMKINPLNSSPAPVSANRANAKPAAGAGQGAAADAEVRLSGASAALSGSGAAPIDQARVQEIRLAIAEGRFQINASAIADRLIDTARDLLQQQGASRSAE